MMLKKLQRKWNVNATDFFWIMICFAITGTTTAWVSKAITSWIEVSKFSFAWWALKIAVLLIGYQVFLLFFGFCFGRFWFFWKYEKKLLSRLGILPKEKKQIRLAIFASGAGSNAKKIIEHFQNHDYIKVSLVVCNKQQAGVLNIARDHNIETLLIKKVDLSNGLLQAQLREKKINWIILAGFLLKIPSDIIKTYPNKIINIHPALLPAYGGEGMYGKRVHDAVLANKESQSGISIHYVDDIYDHGEIIARHFCPVDENETSESLANKIHALEHRHFASTIETIIKNAK
jgi:formyltetrahydrofolate-dependent phosphoribosylglycinamide formyltransferase